MKKIKKTVIILLLCVISAINIVSTYASEKYMLPKFFHSGYEKPEYSVYNTFASDNGLGGKKIYIEGRFKYYKDTKTDLCILFSGKVKDNDKNEWLVALDTDINGTNDVYKNMKDHNVCIIGEYAGKSEKEKMPMIYMYEIFDFNTGKRVKSIFYDSNETTKNNEKEANSETIKKDEKEQELKKKEEREKETTKNRKSRNTDYGTKFQLFVNKMCEQTCKYGYKLQGLSQHITETSSGVIDGTIDVKIKNMYGTWGNYTIHCLVDFNNEKLLFWDIN